METTQTGVERVNRKGTFTENADRIFSAALLVLAVLLGIVIRPYLAPEVKVNADSGRYDYVQLISASYIYKGNQGALLLDKRNGNLWFIGRTSDGMKTAFKDPVFLLHVPLEKLDEEAR